MSAHIYATDQEVRALERRVEKLEAEVDEQASRMYDPLIAKATTASELGVYHDAKRGPATLRRLRAALAAVEGREKLEPGANGASVATEPDAQETPRVPTPARGVQEAGISPAAAVCGAWGVQDLRCALPPGHEGSHEDVGMLWPPLRNKKASYVQSSEVPASGPTRDSGPCGPGPSVYSKQPTINQDKACANADALRRVYEAARALLGHLDMCRVAGIRDLVDAPVLRAALAAAKATETPQLESAREVAERLGFQPLTAEQQQRNLEDEMGATPPVEKGPTRDITCDSCDAAGNLAAMQNHYCLEDATLLEQLEALAERWETEGASVINPVIANTFAVAARDLRALIEKARGT